MASADLDYIRALLVAQTADPEPRRAGPFGWLGGKPRRPAPLSLSGRDAVRPAGPPPARFDDPDQELLLQQLCAAPVAGVETASPLPPPKPRAEFGRRADAGGEIELQPEMELMLEPARPRRLRVLDDLGAPIGEMILHPAEAPATPFFPEDLMDAAPLTPGEPQPMRPWIKALRGSGARPRLEPPPAPKRRSRAAVKAAARPAPARPGLGRDLLTALALTLTREHEALADRLDGLAVEALFEPAAL